MLLASGINPTVRDRQGYTAIQYALNCNEENFSQNMSMLIDEQKNIETGHPILERVGLGRDVIALIIGFLMGFDFDPYAHDHAASRS